ncbi:hypothetical protein SAMN05421810_10771 [Amycolatopsis arida]|uniref:Protein phosphatase 2C n=1 Tax=Amycolatopsis arida TaxID=587909 RepID=A0A1I5YCW0_9PSEU|nr:hypothetical protein CLV69_10771 [Amycolatopsis arida]SFQ42019.1 hypothetical protein SAMN05421810_10771 [Amycolatopsis arida]
MLPNAVVLLDGATAAHPALPSGGWYAGLLRRWLTAALHTAPESDLAELLASAIAGVAADHDLHPGDSPSSTVAILRWTADRVDALVLADSPVVVFGPRGYEVLADDRIAVLRRTGLLRTAADVRERRNAEGGFWVAEADPTAAAHARRASWPRADLTAALLASDGVAVGVDDYGLLDWPGVLDLARTRGPDAVLDAVRLAEHGDPHGVRWPRVKRHDDQTLALVEFGAATG